MIFKDLIDTLKKIKKPEDLTFEVAEQLVTAGITSFMSVEMQEDEDEELEVVEAFDQTRMFVMKIFDVILLDIMMNQLQDSDLDELSDSSPMHDDDFRANIQKAIEEYNKRLK
jgi:hypothetical protein